MRLERKNKFWALGLSLFILITSAVIFVYLQSKESTAEDTLFSESTLQSSKESRTISEQASTTMYKSTPLPEDGFYNSGDDWYYYEDGVISKETDIIFGDVDGVSSWWYVVDGQIDFSYNGVLEGDNVWWLIKNGNASAETGDSIVSAVASYMDVADSDDEIVGFGGYTLSTEVMELMNEAIQNMYVEGYETGFIVMDLQSLQGFAYNADKSFYSASTIKGPYVVSLVSSNPDVLEKESSSIQSILSTSDNEAYSSLRNLYGSDCLQEWCDLAGANLTIDTENKYQNYSASQLAKLWIANYFFFLNSETGQELATWFECPMISPIHTALCSTCTTRSKAGWIAEGGNLNVTNDAGIVYVEDHPYLISIMSSAPSDFDAVCELVGAIEEAHQDMIREM